jgi:hypothetical protein
MNNSVAAKAFGGWGQRGMLDRGGAALEGWGAGGGRGGRKGPAGQSNQRRRCRTNFPVDFFYVSLIPKGDQQILLIRTRWGAGGARTPVPLSLARAARRPRRPPASQRSLNKRSARVLRVRVSSAYVSPQPNTVTFPQTSAPRRRAAGWTQQSVGSLYTSRAKESSARWSARCARAGAHHN